MAFQVKISNSFKKGQKNPLLGRTYSLPQYSGNNFIAGCYFAARKKFVNINSPFIQFPSYLELIFTIFICFPPRIPLLVPATVPCQLLVLIYLCTLEAVPSPCHTPPISGFFPTQTDLGLFIFHTNLQRNNSFMAFPVPSSRGTFPPAAPRAHPSLVAFPGLLSVALPHRRRKV